MEQGRPDYDPIVTVSSLDEQRVVEQQNPGVWLRSLSSVMANYVIDPKNSEKEISNIINAVKRNALSEKQYFSYEFCAVKFAHYNDPADIFLDKSAIRSICSLSIEEYEQIYFGKRIRFLSPKRLRVLQQALQEWIQQQPNPLEYLQPLSED